MEICLHTWTLVGTLKVSQNLAAKLPSARYRVLGEVHEPRPGRPDQSDQEIVCHEDLISASRVHDGDVNFKKLSRVD
jgi:hypothetical protein